MPFPPRDYTLKRGLEVAETASLRLKSHVASARDRMAAGSVQASVILGVLDTTRNARQQLDAVAGLTGIADYARAQYDDPAYDVVAEFNAVRAAAQDVLDRIAADAPGQTLAPSLDGAAFQMVEPTFTKAQTAALRQAIDALIAAIG